MMRSSDQPLTANGSISSPCRRRVQRNVILFIVGVMVLPILVAAQPPDTLWTRTFGGSNIDLGHCVQPTDDGGYVITGYTRSFGTMSGRNVWLVKTDSAGNEEWNNAFGGNDDDEGRSVQQTVDGGYVFAGHTKSFGAGGTDVLLIKTDALGNLAWIETYGGIYDDEGYSVLQTADGGFVIAGATSSFGAGGRDVWLIKTDSSGVQEWTKTHGGMSSDGAWSIRPTSDGGFIITGWTYSHGPGYLGNAWLLKTDSLGNGEWNVAFGDSGVDRGQAAQQTADGGYIVAGYTDSFGAGLYDMLLIKTNSSGTQEWMKTHGGSGRDYGHSVQQTADGGYIVGGYTLSFGAGSEDVWLVKTDANGDEEWSQTYGGTSTDVGYCVQLAADGGYIVAGYTLSFGAGMHDVWLIKTAGGSTGIAEIAVNRLAQNFPNPFNPTTTIRFALVESGDVALSIYDVSGQQVRSLVDEWRSAGRHSIVWDGRDDAGRQVASGVYVYRLRAGQFSRSAKMVITK